MNTFQVKSAIVLIAVLMTLTPVDVEGVFYNTLAGLATDVTVNPIGVIAAIILKKLVLWQLGFGMAGIGKRSIDDSSATPLPIEMLAPSKGEYEQLAARLDINGCIARLVCEIVAEQRDETKMERAILEYFREHALSQGSQTTVPPPGQSIFHYAAFMGGMARRAESCAVLFKDCQRSSTEIKKMTALVFDLDL